MFKVKVVHYVPRSFKDSNGKEVKYNQVYFLDDDGEMASFNTTRDVSSGSVIECTLHQRRNKHGELEFFVK